MEGLFGRIRWVKKANARVDRPTCLDNGWSVAESDYLGKLVLSNDWFAGSGADCEAGGRQGFPGNSGIPQVAER